MLHSPTHFLQLLSMNMEHPALLLVTMSLVLPTHPMFVLSSVLIITTLPPISARATMQGLWLNSRNLHTHPTVFPRPMHTALIRHTPRVRHQLRSMPYAEPRFHSLHRQTTPPTLPQRKGKTLQSLPAMSTYPTPTFFPYSRCPTHTPNTSSTAEMHMPATQLWLPRAKLKVCHLLLVCQRDIAVLSVHYATVYDMISQRQARSTHERHALACATSVKRQEGKKANVLQFQGSQFQLISRAHSRYQAPRHQYGLCRLLTTLLDGCGLIFCAAKHPSTLGSRSRSLRRAPEDQLSTFIRTEEVSFLGTSVNTCATTVFAKPSPHRTALFRTQSLKAACVD